MGRWFFSFLFFLSCTLGAQECRITLASMNVENWFDPVPNGRVADWGYRNRALSEKRGSKTEEWNRELYLGKCKAFQRVLKELGGNIPILAMNEVENSNVLLKAAQDNDFNGMFHTFGHDPRGINSAILLKEHSDIEPVWIDWIDNDRGRDFSGHPSRQILELQLRIAGKYDLLLYVNHWPSQMGPTKARYMVAEKLRWRIAERLEKNPNLYVLATGDFNVTDPERDPEHHPFTASLLDPAKQGHLVDVHPLAPQEGLPPGTYYYRPRAKNRKPEWNRFDRFLVSPNLLGKKGLRVDLNSYRIAVLNASSEEIEVDGKRFRVPLSFGVKKGKGFTDHFPITIDLVW